MTAFTFTAAAGGAVASAPFTVAGPVALHVGAMVSPATSCPASVANWLTLGQSTFGGLLGANKQFYSPGQKMTTWQAGHLATDCEAKLPPHVLSVIAYRDEHIPSLPGYVASIPDDGREVWLALDQEAEDWYPSGDFATFIANTIKASTAIRAVGHPNVRVVQNCAGSKYGVAGSTAAAGQWAVPAQYIDIYSIDCYQNQAAGNWPTKGLANYPEWLNWLGVYARLGRPLAITEYGLCACSGAAARNTQLLMDLAYLRQAFPPAPVQAVTGPLVSPFPLQLWNYWYSNCQAGQFMTDCAHQHQFTDAATIATWKGICAGTL